MQWSKRPPILLLPFDRLEQRLEVARAEALGALALDGPEEHRGAFVRSLPTHVRSKDPLWRRCQYLIAQLFGQILPSDAMPFQCRPGILVAC